MDPFIHHISMPWWTNPSSHNNLHVPCCSILMSKPIKNHPSVIFIFLPIRRHNKFRISPFIYCCLLPFQSKYHLYRSLHIRHKSIQCSYTIGHIRGSSSYMIRITYNLLKMKLKDFSCKQIQTKWKKFKLIRILITAIRIVAELIKIPKTLWSWEMFSSFSFPLCRLKT